MNTKKVSIICICLCVKTTSTLRINPIFKKNKTLKSSLIIPCHPSHAPHLYPLLELYAQQTRLPDEVVISLSEINRVPLSIISNLTNKG